MSGTKRLLSYQATLTGPWGEHGERADCKGSAETVLLRNEEHRILALWALIPENPQKCPRSIGITAYDQTEWVATMPRNTHSLNLCLFLIHATRNPLPDSYPGSLTICAKIIALAAASGRRAHQRCKVLGCPCRIDFSRVQAMLMISNVTATSMSFLGTLMVMSKIFRLLEYGFRSVGLPNTQRQAVRHGE